MPWLTCTTGSPTFSSDRSLISASTSLTCSCLRAPARGRRGGEELGLGDELDRACRRPARARRSPRPAARRRSRTVSSPASNSASDRDARRLDAGGRAAARAGSRAGLRSRRRSARGAASCRRASAAAAAARARRGRRSGRAAAAPSRPAPLPRSASVRSARCVSVKNSSGCRNSSSGGRIGRSRSCCRKRWRSRVSVQKRFSASSTSPCSTSAACVAEVVEDRRRRSKNSGR